MSGIMRTKYRILKNVRIDKLIGRKEDGLSIIYFIDKKTLFGWVLMTKFLGYDKEWFIFNTISEAKNVLKKHMELERELNENNKIVEVIDGSEV